MKEEGSVCDMSPQCHALVGTLRTVVSLDPENSSARWCYPGFSDGQRRAVVSPVTGLALTHQTLKFTPSHWALHPAWWCGSSSWAVWLEKTRFSVVEAKSTNSVVVDAAWLRPLKTMLPK